MHTRALDQLSHRHDFHLEGTAGERRTRRVVWLTAVMMVVEVIGGYLFGSMALLADGWHMGTHVAALSISLFAYRYARRHAANSRFSFGTGKVGALGGFASAVALVMVALLMAFESLGRLVRPEAIQFDHAILVACIGLVVNMASAWMLEGGHDHGHEHDHAGDHHRVEGDRHGHHGHHGDHNLRAAYLHVLADAVTSVLAIVALLAGKYFGWVWLDALMGLVGAALITQWGMGLVGDTSQILLDESPGPETLARIRRLIEADADNRVADLHVWRVGTRDCAAIVSLVTHRPQPPGHYRELLAGEPDLTHVTIEVNPCADVACAVGRPAGLRAR
jgi:cation diffusion facilitator family transporter